MLAFAMPGSFTREEVEQIASLAQLELSADELALFGRQLGDILAYATQVQQIDTTRVAPTASVGHSTTCRPSAKSTVAPAIALPSKRDAGPLTLTRLPTVNHSRFTPQRSSALIEVASTSHVLGLPSAALVATAICTCGLIQ